MSEIVVVSAIVLDDVKEAIKESKKEIRSNTEEYIYSGMEREYTYLLKEDLLIWQSLKVIHRKSCKCRSQTRH